MKWTEQTAMAVRDVACLWEMGTMWAEPLGVRWVSFGEEDVFFEGGGLALEVEKRRVDMCDEYAEFDCKR